MCVPARDAGANVVVAKPLSPEILLQRIHWVARESRSFIVAPNYAGPDRRFKNVRPAGRARTAAAPTTCRWTFLSRPGPT